jgi:hypothetical protein
MPTLRRIISYVTPSVSKLSISSSAPTSKQQRAPGYTSLDWLDHRSTHYPLANFNIVTFNLLAPCYKRMPTRNLLSGHRDRESDYPDIWRKRQDDTLMILKENIFPTCSIVAFQEYWLDEMYACHFESVLDMYNYQLIKLQRTGSKMDAVALAVKRDVFTILSEKDISLGSAGDRVALLLLIKHNHSQKDMIVAATHLSFPHNAIDRISQMRQMRRLTSCIDNFAKENQVDHATRIVLGDFNVEGESPVCDHLRSEGYYSCSEITPPRNIFQATPKSILRIESGQNGTVPRSSDFISSRKLKVGKLTSVSAATKSDAGENREMYHHLNDTTSGSGLAPVSRYTVKFVSHRTHRSEDLGVDHIFIKPEYEFITSSTSSSTNSSSGEEEKADSSTTKAPEDKLICSGGIFIDGTEIVPHRIPCLSWQNSFTASDHRPFGASIVVGRKMSEHLDFEI